MEKPRHSGDFAMQTGTARKPLAVPAQAVKTVLAGQEKNL